MHEIRKTCQLPTIEHDVPCSLCSQAVAAQTNLGDESLLMGYLVKDWTIAIAEHYRPPPKPTNDPSAKPAPHPSHLSTILVDELWKLWLHIWCTRTNILLDGNNRVTSAEDARITARLLHFKQHHTTMLRQCDWQRTSFAAISLTNWKTKMKKDILRSLERLHSIYENEKQLLAKGQCTLTNWLKSASNPT